MPIQRSVGPLFAVWKSSARPRRRCQATFAPGIPTSTGVAWLECATALIHDYFGVDYELVWDVVQHRVPEVRRQMETILKA